jgi:hypothetical protein
MHEFKRKWGTHLLKAEGTQKEGGGREAMNPSLSFHIKPDLLSTFDVTPLLQVARTLMSVRLRRVKHIPSQMKRRAKK